MVIGKHFTKYYLKYAVYFIVGIAALFLVDLYQLKIPAVVGTIVDGIQYATITRDDLLGYVKQLIIVALVVFTGRFVWRICIFGNGVRIEADIRSEMFKYMERLSARYFSENKTGALMALYTNDLSTIRQSFARGTLLIVDAASLGIVAFYKMIKLNVYISIACLIPLIFVFIFTTLMRRRISRKVKKNLEAYSSLSDYTQETYSGINVIKAYVKEKRRAFLFQDYNKENMDTCLDFVQDQVIVQVVINTILAIVTAGIIFIGGYIIYSAVNSNNTLDFKVGDLISFNAYFASLVWPVMAIGDLINLRGQSKAAEKRISDLLDEQVEINDLNKELLIDENPSGKICFNDVTFRYPDTNVDVLKNISFTIDSGSFTGIMGPTGAGKSTIVELLLRLYNLEDNKILIDDLDIMHLKIKDIRDMIAYAPQEVFLFKQSISSNIAFSSDEIDLPKVQDAASFAGIAKDISEFTKGYDTVLGERGVTVSGGQKQRITIARALIKDAPILILDDSLSAVDTITEKEILSYLRKTRAGKTTIIIAHRITTLETLDKIIVVNKGMIEAVGTHEELLQTSSTYQKEVHLQELEKEVEA